MSKLSRKSFGKLCWVACVCLSLGCAGRAGKVESEVKQPKPPEKAWSWVPANATTIGRVGLTELRKTKLWPIWTELQGEQQLAMWVALDKITRVTFGGTGQKRDDLSYVAALEGDFAEDELALLATRDHIEPQQQGILRVYARPEGFWTQISDKLILSCTTDRLEELVARATAGEGVPVAEQALYKSLAERIGLEEAHLALLVDDPDGSRRAQLDRQLSRYGMGAIAREANRMGVSLEIGADYRLTAVAETSDEEHGVVLQDEVKKTLDSVASNLFVRMFGIAQILSQVRVSQSDNYVFVRGNVAEIDVNNAIERVHSALSLAAGAGSLSEVQ